jgi:predicted XRE-type DNA-binding protein
MSTPEVYSSPLIDEILARITPQERDKVSLKMQLAVRIADLIEEKHLSKNEVAEACGLKDPSVVTKWLSGGYNFSVDTLVDINHALGVSLADLVRPEEQ